MAQYLGGRCVEGGGSVYELSCGGIVMHSV
jgi:hypothetical protein